MGAACPLAFLAPAVVRLLVSYLLISGTLPSGHRSLSMPFWSHPGLLPVKLASSVPTSDNSWVWKKAPEGLLGSEEKLVDCSGRGLVAGVGGHSSLSPLLFLWLLFPSLPVLFSLFAFCKSHLSLWTHGLDVHIHQPWTMLLF